MARSMVPNWFIGIPVSPTPWFDRCVPEPPKAFRRFHPDDLHMTIAFLGPVEERCARAGWHAMTWSLVPLTITLGSVIPMGAAHRYSALSIEIIQGKAEIESAMAQCRDAIADAADVRRETRPPKAHITIARPQRRATQSDREAGLQWAHRLNFKNTSVSVDSVALYTWADDRRIRQFTVVERALAQR